MSPTEERSEKMKQVKYFDEEYTHKLEQEINEFLSNPEHEYVDIKFQSERSSDSYGGEILFSALLTYEKKTITPTHNSDKSLEIIKGWANLKAAEFQEEWTEDDELQYRKMFGEALMCLPDEVVE